MKYRIVYQFKWFIVIWLLLLIYLSNLILIKLPFVSIVYPSLLQILLPKVDFEFQIYNIQTIIVWISGILFGPEMGFLTLSIYLLLGFLGLPVFASGGGIDYYKEPTFGYLISLPLLAYLSGLFYEQNKKLLAVFIPIFTTHLFGILYLLLFNRSWLDITWHLSFSMVSYDLIFVLLLTPLIPFVSFFLREIFIQEIPARDPFLEPSTRNIK